MTLPATSSQGLRSVRVDKGSTQHHPQRYNPGLSRTPSIMVMGQDNPATVGGLLGSPRSPRLKLTPASPPADNAGPALARLGKSITLSVEMLAAVGETVGDKNPEIRGDMLAACRESRWEKVKHDFDPLNLMHFSITGQSVVHWRACARPCPEAPSPPMAQWLYYSTPPHPQPQPPVQQAQCKRQILKCCSGHWEDCWFQWLKSYCWLTMWWWTSCCQCLKTSTQSSAQWVPCNILLSSSKLSVILDLKCSPLLE